jgi:hypothetical protein
MIIPRAREWWCIRTAGNGMTAITSLGGSIPAVDIGGAANGSNSEQTATLIPAGRTVYERAVFGPPSCPRGRRSYAAQQAIGLDEEQYVERAVIAQEANATVARQSEDGEGCVTSGVCLLGWTFSKRDCSGGKPHLAIAIALSAFARCRNFVVNFCPTTFFALKR